MTSPRVVVIGLGCIGGSLARALTERSVDVRGWSTSQSDCDQARSHGIDVRVSSVESAVSDADVVMIAVPAQAIAEVAVETIRFAPAATAIVHCGGLQSRGALQLDEATFTRVIGAHPLAGSHESGFGASRADLFDRCTVSIESRAPTEVRERMQWMWTMVGAAQLDYRSAGEHDSMMAWVSHLPQLAATALASTFAAEHIDPQSIGPGARDSTRLAASSFDQWSALIRAEPAVLGAALRGLESNLARIRGALATDDHRELKTMWESAQAWRRAAERPA
jgi:prephenate dehydrogenase